MKIKLYVFILLIIPFGISANENLKKSRIFIEELGKKVITDIADVQISPEQRQMNFRKLYFNAFDNEYISKFVLGRHWNKIDTKTKQKFIKSFNDYLIMIYAPKFKGWSGKFKTLSSEFQDNMYVVSMSLVSNKKAPTLKLDWRMYIAKTGNFKILDVNIDGVSMLVTQRAEFSSVIKNHPKGVNGLIEQMVKKVKSLHII
ncbi:ABC transporter substrate-binding protein [Rickettsiales bacterium]|nr:ABC transporter substrate-binding protein [Rickettsiales bacterium]